MLDSLFEIFFLNVGVYHYESLTLNVQYQELDTSWGNRADFSIFHCSLPLVMSSKAFGGTSYTILCVTPSACSV